ncbi:hypothetical protein GQ457_09G029770 [Hibiscus cannabinus]
MASETRPFLKLSSYILTYVRVICRGKRECLQSAYGLPGRILAASATGSFRSAQALGGHMNVHRRDRAKLKQVQSLDDHSRVPSSTPKRPLGDAITGSDDDDDDFGLRFRVETKLFVGLSSVLTCNKRPKVVQCQVLELEPASSMGDLDLELRLGVL